MAHKVFAATLATVETLCSGFSRTISPDERTAILTARLVEEANNVFKTVFARMNQVPRGKLEAAPNHPHVKIEMYQREPHVLLAFPRATVTIDGEGIKLECSDSNPGISKINGQHNWADGWEIQIGGRDDTALQSLGVMVMLDILGKMGVTRFAYQGMATVDAAAAGKTIMAAHRLASK